MALGPADADADARMHRLINAAKFEVEEIQRRHRQNEADADNLDKEMEKMQIEGRTIESEVAQLRGQTAQYAAEYDRVSKLVDGAEEERNLLDETLRQKKAALGDFQRKMEEDDRDHEEMMKKWREKFARSNEEWEKVPHIRELRDWEKKRDDDRQRIEDLRKEKADVVERMEKKKAIDERMKEFESTSELWVHLAKAGVEHERLREQVGRKKDDLVAQKGVLKSLRMNIEKKKSRREEEAAKEHEERPSPRQQQRQQQQQQQQQRPRVKPTHGENKSQKKGREKSRGQQEKPKKIRDKVVSCSSSSSPPSSTMPPPAVAGLALVGPISPPRRDAMPRSSTMMKTPQLNIPSFLMIGNAKNDAAQAEATPSRMIPTSSAAVASRFDVPMVEVAPSFFCGPDVTATSEDTPSLVGAQAEANDSFTLDLSLDNSRDREKTFPGFENLSFNADCAASDGNYEAGIFGGGGGGGGGGGRNNEADFSFDF